MMSSAGLDKNAGAFAPFRAAPFALLWCATVLSNIGTWMMSTASAWMMADLSPSPMMIAAVQAASAAPIFLFALLAGALSDLFDKRRLLLFFQGFAAFGAVMFTMAVHFGLITASLLLAFTVFMSTCAAFVAPAWQAIVPQLVERPALPQALALNSMGINVARAIGPACAGLLIVTIGVVAPFAADSLSYVFIIAALWWWKPKPLPASKIAREHVISAMIGGLRYAANSDLKAVLIRSAGFFFFSSAAMSLLPVVVRDSISGDASTYGLLMAAIGVGAIGGTFLLPRLNAASPGTKLLIGTTLTSVGTITLALAPSLAPALAASAFFGLGWIAVLGTLNAAAQLSLPNWVRARGLALFTMVFSGTMMVGSIVWGSVAQATGLRTALYIAGVMGFAAVIALSRYRLGNGSADHVPSAHWPKPIAAMSLGSDQGPVMVSINYRIDPTKTSEMLASLYKLEPARRRGGAIWWAAFQDVAAPDRIIEIFVEQSWAAHLRHHERVSGEDRKLQETVAAFHLGPELPVVTHWLALESGPDTTKSFYVPSGSLG
jgi:MFS family permease